MFLAMALNNALGKPFLRQKIIPLYLSFTRAHGSRLRPMYIGDREVVGFGVNNECGYCDNQSFPFPAVRFQEPTPDILALREKEKGDWRKLSIDEKKELYRYSFCQTFAEMDAPNGLWKMFIGKVLILASIGIWVFLVFKIILPFKTPITFEEDRRKAQLERMLALEINPVLGLGSKWNPKDKCWK